MSVFLCSPYAQMPSYATDAAAGLDLHAALVLPMVIAAGDIVKVPTGIAIAIPLGFEGQVRPRSGLAAKHGITVLNAPGTIDADYRGEIQVLLINHAKQAYTIAPGERIAQLVIAPVAKAVLRQVASLDALGHTPRQDGGFGSTGK